MDLGTPKTHTFGGNELVELKHLETTFEISRRVALLYLKALRIQPLYFKNEIYFSLPTFNRIIFVLSQPGSPGFLFPASTAKANAILCKKSLTRVTDAILEEAKTPRVLAEMAAASGLDMSMVKKLLSQDNVNSKLKKDEK